MGGLVGLLVAESVLASEKALALMVGIVQLLSAVWSQKQLPDLDDHFLKLGRKLLTWDSRVNSFLSFLRVLLFISSSAVVLLRAIGASVTSCFENRE